MYWAFIYSSKRANLCIVIGFFAIAKTAIEVSTTINGFYISFCH